MINVKNNDITIKGDYEEVINDISKAILAITKKITTNELEGKEDYILMSIMLDIKYVIKKLKEEKK